MCHGNLKKYYLRVLLDKLYTLMDMYRKPLKKSEGKVIMEILLTKV